jgi:hypothetical protein
MIACVGKPDFGSPGPTTITIGEAVIKTRPDHFSFRKDGFTPSNASVILI